MKVRVFFPLGARWEIHGVTAIVKGGRPMNGSPLVFFDNPDKKQKDGAAVIDPRCWITDEDGKILFSPTLDPTLLKEMRSWMLDHLGWLEAPPKWGGANADPVSRESFGRAQKSGKSGDPLPDMEISEEEPPPKEPN